MTLPVVFRLTSMLLTVALVSGCATQDLLTEKTDSVDNQVLRHINQIGVDDVPAGNLGYNRSVRELIKIGWPALPKVLPLMLSEKEIIRARAYNVIVSISNESFGFIDGRGWPDPETENRFWAFWHQMGDLKADGDRDAREKSVKLWLQWLIDRQKEVTLLLNYPTRFSIA